MENGMDLYKILGVTENAGAEVIKKAYRKLVKECHPDTHPGDRRAEERFRQVSEAYAVLSDGEKRAQYDRKRNIRKAESHDASADRKRDRKSDGQPFTSKGFHSDFAEFKKNPLNTDALFEKYMGFK